MTDKLRVLVVDDKDENLYYLQVLLEGNGFFVSVAHHGVEALEFARRNPPSVVVSDLLMPVMDGYALLRHWKTDPVLKSIPFVVYTATYTEPEDEQLAYGLGADAFLLKPLDPDRFVTRLRAAMLKSVHTGVDLLTTEGGQPDLFKLYSSALVRKLEEKTVQLTEANKALLHEKAELMMRERAIRAVSQGIVIADATQPDHPIVYASPSFERLTGYSASEVLGKNCRLLQGKDTDQAAVQRLRDSLRAKQACVIELLNYKKDGTPFWNSLALSPVFDETGALVNFVGVQADVTEKRELESQLRQAHKMEAVGQLAAGVAHDFNNILSVILGYASFLLDDLPASNPIRPDVEQMHRAAERATELTQQLLAFSRRQVLQPRVIDPGQAIQGMESMLRRMIGEDYELRLLTQSDAGRILADPTQIEQIVMNLTLNARDAMPTGGRLTIETSAAQLDEGYSRLHHDVKPGAYVMIVVTDTGAGMDLATQERIFEPFFTTKAPTKGTGLGLSTVFGIVKQSGGHIWVYSEPGQGTTFKVYLPRVDQDLQPVMLQTPATNLHGNETVLVVEDDDQVRGMTRATLARNGYTVLEAKDGAEALSLAANYASAIHLLLTDVVMPRMSGKQLADQLGPQRPSMKILFVSGYTENTIVHRGVLDPGVAFLQKPTIPDALLRRVRELLGPPR